MKDVPPTIITRFAATLRDTPLRKKALIGIGTMLALLIGIFSWTLSRTLVANFDSLQDSTSLQQVSRVLQSVEQAGRELNALLYNYTCWTVTYDYAQGKNPAYWEDNYMPLLFQENTLDVVLVYNMQGAYIGGRAYDPETQMVAEPGSDLIGRILKTSHLLGGALEEKRTTGFVRFPQGILMAAARPIYNDMGEGPAAGVMIFGRFLRPAYLDRLGMVSGVKFAMAPGIPPEMAKASIYDSSLLGGATVHILHQGVGTDQSQGYATLRDIDGKKSVNLRVELSTGIHDRMEESRRDIMLLAVCGSMILALLVLGLVEVLVLKPLAQIEGDVNQVSRNANGSKRMLVRGGDEFGGLAKSVNHMLDELHKSELRYAMLAEVSPVGMFQTDALGNCSYVNHRCSEILGRNSADLLQGGLIAAISPKHVDGVLENWLRSGNRGRFSREFTMTRPDGAEVWVLGQASPQVNSEGELVGYVGTLTDISERIRLEQEQMKVSKLESIGVLAGGIAHDFRNLLTPILCNISLARLETDNPVVLECLEQAQEAVNQTNELTQQLLIFSRGGAPVRRAAVLQELLHESTRLALSGSNVEGRFGIAKDLWPVEVDPAQLSRVIQNLVINAVQAMPAGGKISVCAENVESIEHPALEYRRGRHVRIEVRDYGQGISEHDLSKIFDPYFTTKAEGNGLGLATAFSIVRHHYGEIGVQSKLGEGTTFSLYLPATDRKLEPDQAVDGLVRTGTGKILILDDDPSVIATLRYVLVRLGYSVDAASVGEDALRLYEKAYGSESGYDAVVLDLTIKGGLGGKDTMTGILNMDPHAKGIVSSGYSDDTVLANYRTHGFCEVLPKPFTVEQVSQVLKKVLGDRLEGAAAA